MTELAVATDSSLAIHPGQSGFTGVQIAALRQIGTEDATDADLQVFFHHAARTGLDPFARQIYMIGRETDVKVRVQLDNGNSRVETQRMTKFTIQTGIDGYRLIGERAAVANGDTIEHDDPLWRGKPGTDFDHWSDYWPEGVGTPAACKYTIWKNGKRRSAVVNFNEYAQYSGRGELTSMWKKMPANQLAKCGEAQAWRKAYPADFSGIILEGTDQSQVIDTAVAPVRVSSQRRGVDGLRAAIASPAEKVDSEPDKNEATIESPQVDDGDLLDGAPAEECLTKPQLQKLSILRQREGYADTDEGRADWFQWVQVNIGRLVGSNKDLTKAEASVLIDVLESAQPQDDSR